MPKNSIEKIWDAHIVAREEGVPDVFFIDLQLLHEVTSPQAFSALKKRGKCVFSPARNVATVDHSIPTDEKREQFADEKNRKQIEVLRKNCAEYNIPLFDVDSGHQGIVHVIGPELGLTQPGMTIVCGDSHTATHGAFGAIAFGIGTTQVAHVLESSCLLLEQPKTMRVTFSGMPSVHFSAKDAILLLINRIGVQGGTGFIIEYSGEFIARCSIEERMTLCNMSIECGARAGMVAPDETTFSFLKKTPVFREMNAELWEKKKRQWKGVIGDMDATFDREVNIDLRNQQPRVSWGTTPAQNIAIDETIPQKSEMTSEEAALAEKSLAYTRLSFGQKILGTKVENVFLGSCTNGRLSDLREAAQIIKGKKVANGVHMFVVPGSELVEKRAKEEGLHNIFREAGAEFRRPGCSACLAMNGDSIPAGERCASTSNRNFVGRQGEGAITHLMSPKMAAMAAITGKISRLS